VHHRDRAFPAEGISRKFHDLTTCRRIENSSVTYQYDTDL